MKLLFIVKGEPAVELQIYGCSEKDAIAKAQKIAPRERMYVYKVFQQEEESTIGVLEELVEAVRNIEFLHNR